MTISTHPTSVQQYRNQTDKPSHAGVMSPTFKCRSCKGFKKTSGRVKHPAGGYKCGDCAGREVRDGNGAQKETATVKGR